MGEQSKSTQTWKWIFAIGGLAVAYAVGYGEGGQDKQDPQAYDATTVEPAPTDTAALTNPADTPTSSPTPELASTSATDAPVVPASATQSGRYFVDASGRITLVPDDTVAQATSQQGWRDAPVVYPARQPDYDAHTSNSAAAPANNPPSSLATYVAPSDGGASARFPSASGASSASTVASSSPSAFAAPQAPVSPSPACSESGSCYGDLSTVTGLPKTTYVHGYTRKDGTYVRSYYRSRR